MIDSKISTTEAIFMIVTVIVAHTLSSLPQNLIIIQKQVHYKSNICWCDCNIDFLYYL